MFEKIIYHSKKKYRNIVLWAFFIASLFSAFCYWLIPPFIQATTTFEVVIPTDIVVLAPIGHGLLIQSFVGYVLLVYFWINKTKGKVTKRIVALTILICGSYIIIFLLEPIIFVICVVQKCAERKVATKITRRKENLGHNQLTYIIKHSSYFRESRGTKFWIIINMCFVVLPYLTLVFINIPNQFYLLLYASSLITIIISIMNFYYENGTNVWGLTDIENFRVSRLVNKVEEGRLSVVKTYDGMTFEGYSEQKNVYLEKQDVYKEYETETNRIIVVPSQTILIFSKDTTPEKFISGKPIKIINDEKLKVGYSTINILLVTIMDLFRIVQVVAFVCALTIVLNLLL